MPTYTIREAGVLDVQRIVELMRELARFEKLEHTFECSPGQLRKCLFENPVAGCYVAIAEDEIVGYAVFYRTFSTFLGRPGFWLEDLYVTPSHRGRGVGKGLLRRVAAETHAQGPGRMEWSVLDWNESAMAFYRALGAEVLPDWRICRLESEALAAFAAPESSCGTQPS